ncbi:MAG TPA: molybdate ABC transporter substrate-binding protein [Isosphaeraceae bacterium]|nr:molybdate ABC transporter substrate-binding protein [Isosphaeraceae bacterium]
MSRSIIPGGLWGLGLAALTPAGCHRGPRTDARPLQIAAASDLQRVLPRLIERFQNQAATTTTLTIDASGRLAEQIKAGAPFDLFLSANLKFVSDLAAAGLVEPASVRPYARGSLVLCLHRAAGDQVRGLADLSRPEIKRIAIANPEYAPYGVAARQALERSGLWSSLQSKIVRANSVGQALTYVQNGDAEAALVSQALVAAPEVRVIEVDAALNDPLIQTLGIVAATNHRGSDFVFGFEDST